MGQLRAALELVAGEFQDVISRHAWSVAFKMYFLLAAILNLYIILSSLWVGVTILLAVKSKSLGLHWILHKALIAVFEAVTRRLNYKRKLKAASDVTRSHDILSDSDDDDYYGDVTCDDDSKATASMRLLDDSKDNSATSKHPFCLSDTVSYASEAIMHIIDDDVTKGFDYQNLQIWNCLRRSEYTVRDINSRQIQLVYAIGFIFRYCVMLPMRLAFLSTVIVFYVSSFIGLRVLLPVFYSTMPPEDVQVYAQKVYVILFRLMARVFSIVIVEHDPQNLSKSLAQNRGLCCVANHTSPIDVLILSTQHPYTLIGQKQPGLFGFVQQCLTGLKGQPHIWFDRLSANDRNAVKKLMQRHVEAHKSNAILIFPEGTCINNTTVVQFKKGAFELDAVIQPIAMKYDSRLGEAFWNSLRHPFYQYIARMLTSWSIYVDLYYLPPMTKRNNEMPIEFAKRVKKAIAKKGGFVDLDWDGMVKRSKPKQTILEHKQKIYSETLDFEHRDT